LDQLQFVLDQTADLVRDTTLVVIPAKARKRNSPIIQRPVTPAKEAVTQFTLGKTVLSICLFARTAGVRKQPFITASWIFSGHLPAEIKRFSGFSQPFAGEANWMTSSKAGVHLSTVRACHCWEGSAIA